MAYDMRSEWNAETMNYGGVEPKLKRIRLKDATEEDIKKHYKERTPLRDKFEAERPLGYISNLGGFNCNPLLAHYKYFLKDEGIAYIAIKDD